MRKIFTLALVALLVSMSLCARTSANRRIVINKDIELLKLSEYAYVHISYDSLPEYGRFSSNGLVYLQNGKAFLFDTPHNEEITKVLVDYIKESLHAKVIGFVPNHYHRDCMGGLGYIKEKRIPSYAHIKTVEIAKKKNYPIPKQWFLDSLIVDFEEKEIQLFYLGAGHSEDNIVAWIPSERILFAGCMVKSLDSKGKGNITDADEIAWPITISKVISKFPNAWIVIPGHGSIGSIDLLYYTKELLTK